VKTDIIANDTRIMKVFMNKNLIYMLIYIIPIISANISD
jgi:hypothetical protein